LGPLPRMTSRNRFVPSSMRMRTKFNQLPGKLEFDSEYSPGEGKLSHVCFSCSSAPSPLSTYGCLGHQPWRQTRRAAST
jgi:hypothetical protein